ncbi:tRNA (5-methylaminomethyl-2-thiouridylate)-methyltransferase [hydrothermal vent metagenome]|uniref:tRNA (5-methylaminomethyl-2-thiouridylate)-methyltransferase n=1 Tax=hydrothermal vent metagenome TaxID=652676 RepID=A0A1W1EIX1_9ZZZZ
MKAISLFSGGLDSCLAIKLIKEQGIDVIAMYIDTGFGGTKDNLAHLENMCKQVGAELKVVNIKEQFIQDVLFDPKYGYGKNFNPCIDCHANMFRLGKAMMKEWGASFLISGEVLGQRPMSQRSDALKNVLKLAETEDILLRPLSAKLLEPTLPEKEGWVDRDKLLDISGRGREVQLAMAKEIGLEDYESPGGGCLLTDENFSNKLREFIKYDNLESSDIEILKFGRHFRLNDGAKLIVGRNQDDNAGLQKIDNSKFLSIKLPIAGPFSLISKDASLKDLELGAKIAITYAKSSPDSIYDIEINSKDNITVSPFENKSQLQEYFFNSKK